MEHGATLPMLKPEQHKACEAAHPTSSGQLQVSSIRSQAITCSSSNRKKETALRA